MKIQMLHSVRRLSLLKNLGAMLLVVFVLTGWAAVAQAVEPRAPKVANFEFTIGSRAGATPDVFMRRLAKALAYEKIVTQPIVVNNRPGGGWVVVTNFLLGRPGHEGTLMTINPTVFTTPIVQGMPSFVERLTLICLLARMDLFIMVRPDSPLMNMADFVAHARKKERGLQMAGANVGSTDHIVAALIERAAKVKINFVPFDGGGGPILSAFLGGSVDSIVLPPDEALPLIQGGRARAIAVLSEKRRPEAYFKDIPTAREVGVDVVWNSWYGISAPPGLDPAVVAWWSDNFARLSKSRAWQDAMQEMYLEIVFVGSDRVKAQVEEIDRRFLTVLRDVGLSKR